jgi:hypothetical protein
MPPLLSTPTKPILQPFIPQTENQNFHQKIHLVSQLPPQDTHLQLLDSQLLK